jgi:ABC-type antimicrobial peptide transport system permease subunit
MALGASRVRTVLRIAGAGLGQVALGVAAGLAVALGASGLLASLLYGVPPRDPLTFLAVGGTLLLVGAVAAAAPALRASRVDPARTLTSQE